MQLINNFVILALVVFMVSCASTAKTDQNKEKEKELSEPELYQQAKTALDKKDYIKAIDKLKNLETRFPFGTYADQAQLDLIYSYYKNMEPESAKMAAERFIRLHPQHPNVDYAYYMRGLASNTADDGLIDRYFPIDVSSRDPGQAKASFAEFSEFIQKFPNSEYAPDAQKRMIRLRNRMARYELHAAYYYLKRKAYIAAINRGRYVVEHFQGTDVVEYGLKVMLEGYTKLGLEEPAKNVQAVLDENYSGKDAASEDTTEKAEDSTEDTENAEDATDAETVKKSEKATNGETTKKAEKASGTKSNKNSAKKTTTASLEKEEPSWFDRITFGLLASEPEYQLPPLAPEDEDDDEPPRSPSLLEEMSLGLLKDEDRPSG